MKLDTGDTSETAAVIAKEIEFKGYEKCISGNELMRLDDTELREKVKTTQVFTRIFQDAKLLIVKCIKGK